MRRTYVVPMVGPASGKGTSADPWRPKYVREAGLAFSCLGNFRHAMLCVVEGEAAALDALSAQADVIEIPAGKLIARQQQALTAILARRGVVLDADVAGDALVPALMTAIAKKQKTETPAERVAVLAAIRA